MRAAGSTIVYCAAAMALWVSGGCSKWVDEHRPIEKVRADAKRMDTRELRRMVLEYRAAIEVEQAAADRYGESYASRGQAKYEAAQKSLAGLKERFQIFYDELKDKGGDVSGLAIN